MTRKLDTSKPASSLARLNQILGRELVRGEGYYYFTEAIGISFPRWTHMSESVFVSNHKRLTIAQWIAERDARFNSQND